MPHPTETILTDERPVALVVEATFDAETFTMRDGVRYLTPAETLALSRSLLSRLAYVGFPEEVTP